MKARERLEIELKLSVLRSEAEELHALLFDGYPAQARRFQKIAQYAGELHTCLRVHQTLPDVKKTPPLIEAAKVATRLSREVNNISRLIPKQK